MTIREVINHGQKRWRVDYGKRDGKRRVEFYKNEGEVKAAIGMNRKDLRAIGKQWAKVPVRQRLDLAIVLAEMEKQGVTLRQVWTAYQNERMRPVDLLKRRTLEQALAELLAAKQTANRRDIYVESLESYLGNFIKGRESTPVDRITTPDINAWFSGRKEAATTRASNLGRLSSLFGYCERHGYIAKNPCKAIESVTIDAKLPIILTVKQTRGFLDICAKRRPRNLAYFAIGFFDGPRPDAELGHLDWSDIDLDSGRAKLHRSKRRKPRILHLSPCTVDWLRTVKKKKGPVTWNKQQLSRARRAICKALKIKWHQDIMRKTAASYQLALTTDPAAVAYKFATSERMLSRWYIDGLVTKEDAEAFFSITPKARRKAKARIAKKL